VRLKVDPPLNARKQFEGRIVSSNGDSVTLSVTKLGAVARSLAKIASASLILTDALIKATAPLSTEGADKIQVEG
jgi:ribosome maturation factor RimP